MIANTGATPDEATPPFGTPAKIILPLCRLWLTSTERRTKPVEEMTPDEQLRYGPQIMDEKAAFMVEFRSRLARFLADAAEGDEERKLALAVEQYVEDAKKVYQQLIKVTKYWEVRIVGDAESGIIPQLDNLRVAPQFLKGDSAFIERLLSKDPYVFSYVPAAFKKNRQTVLKAVTFSGSLLAHMDDEFKRDHEVVQAAVENDGLALKYAATALRRDRKIALAAVRQNGLALQYVGEKLKQPKDNEVLMAAIEQNPQAIIHAGEKIVGPADYFSMPGDEYPSYARDLGEKTMATAKAMPTSPSGPEIKADRKIIMEIALRFPRILDYFVEGHPIWDDEEFVWSRINLTNSIPKRIGMKLRNNARFILLLMEKRAKKFEDCRHDSYVLSRYAGGELRGDAEFLEKMLMFRIDVNFIASWIMKDNFTLQGGAEDIAAGT